jgi:hypothetical protein
MHWIVTLYGLQTWEHIPFLWSFYPFSFGLVMLNLVESKDQNDIKKLGYLYNM